jgi:hypothetical protein
MPASTQADGVVNTVRGAAHRAAERATPTLVHLAGQVLVIGDLVLAQLVGLPGTQACRAYLSGWWGCRICRGTNRQRAAGPRSQVAPASAIAVRDRERS